MLRDRSPSTLQHGYERMFGHTRGEVLRSDGTSLREKFPQGYAVLVESGACAGIFERVDVDFPRPMMPVSLAPAAALL